MGLKLIEHVQLIKQLNSCFQTIVYLQLYVANYSYRDYFATCFSDLYQGKNIAVLFVGIKYYCESDLSGNSMAHNYYFINTLWNVAGCTDSN